jgi:DNA polymerase-3 subunit delta
LRFFLLNKEIQDKDLVPCYFLFGEETFLAQEFLGQLKALLIPPDAQDFNLERFHLEDSSWLEVMDLARTSPFIFSPWRIIFLELPSSEKKEKEGDEKKGREMFSAKDEVLVRAYLTAPAPKTVLVVVFPGKANASRRIIKFFTSFPPSVVLAKELKPLKGAQLYAWMERKLAGLGKTMSDEAKRSLADLVGNDLQRLDKELDKLATYVGDRRSIDEEDAKQATGGTRDLESWELENALEARDTKKCLTVLANLFLTGQAPEYILGMLSGFFRGILTAHDGLREGRDKKEIFRALRPRITESYGKWYYDRLNDFFSVVEGMTRKGLDDYLQELGRIDSRLKTTDVSARAQFEAFVIDFCRRQQPERVTWKARR